MAPNLPEGSLQRNHCWEGSGGDNSEGFGGLDRGNAELSKVDSSGWFLGSKQLTWVLLCGRPILCSLLDGNLISPLGSEFPPPVSVSLFCL